MLLLEAEGEGLFIDDVGAIAFAGCIAGHVDGGLAQDSA